MEQHQISASYILVQTQDLLSLKINYFLVKIKPKERKKERLKGETGRLIQTRKGTR